MSLGSIVNNAVKSAFATADDLRTTITYRSITFGTYDPATNTATPTNVEVAVTDVVATGLTEEELDWFPQSDTEKQKLIISAVPLGLTPSDDDEVVIAGRTWSVKKVKSVPGGSVFIVYVQAA